MMDVKGVAGEWQCLFFVGERILLTNGRQGEMVSSRAGLRRGILLGLRESAKSIAAEPELACGSNS